MRLTYYPPPEPEQDEQAPKTFECATDGCNTTGPDIYCAECSHRFGYVRYGYTLADLHSFARLAVHTCGQMGMDWHERYDLAYSGIVEHLYSNDRPEKYHLVRAGQLALYAVINDHQRHHGFYKAKTIGAAAGPGSSPAFARFWSPLGMPFPSPEGHIVERETLRQIWPVLTDRQREAITALATLENYRSAAEHLGIKYDTFKNLIMRTRRVFFALWHEGEEPSRPWGTDRRVLRYEEPAA